MIGNDELECFLNNLEDVEKAVVTGDGYHYQVVVVSDIFNDMKPVKRQQWVYKHLREFITNGSLHAVTIYAHTKEEQERQHG